MMVTRNGQQHSGKHFERAGEAIPPALLVGAAFSFLYWGWVWLTPLWHSDDYMLATRSKLPYGQFRWEDILRDSWWYFWEVNGRLSDSVSQMIMASGGAVALLAALLHCACAVGTYLCIQRTLRSTGNAPKVATIILSVLLPFIVVAFDSSLAAELYHFFAGTVSALGGYCCAVWTLWLAQKTQEEGSFGKYFYQMLAVFALTGFMHELSSFFLVPAVLVLIVGHWKYKETWAERLVLLPLLVLALARLAAPGMWRRVGVVNENVYSDASVLTHLDRLTLAFARFFTVSMPLMIVFMLCLFAAGLLIIPRSKNMRVKAFLPVVGLLLTVLWVILGKNLLARIQALAWDDYSGLHNVLHSLQGKALFGVVALTCGMAIIIAVELSRFLEDWLFFTLFLGAMATALIPLSLGNAFGRQVFFLEAFLVVMIIVLLDIVYSELQGFLRKATGSLVFVTVAFAVCVTGVHTVHLWTTQNEYQAFVEQIESVRNADSTEIDTRISYTYPYIFDASHVSRPDMMEAIPLYYGLAPQTEVLLP